MRQIVNAFDNEWTTELLDEIYDAIEEIAVGEWKYDIFKNQIEIISSEGMLEAYATIGLPVMYHHWSFGKRYLSQSRQYKAGLMGLAYEIVINADPCIAYLMERNTLTMQTLVMAHACVSGDTEYLTPLGWKRIDQYQGGVVGQYERDGKVRFVKPTAYINRPQSSFIHVKGAKVEQKITDDHRVIFVNGNGNIVEITGAELQRRQAEKTRGFNGRFITGFQIEPYEDPWYKPGIQLIDDEIRLHVAIKADGSILENKHTGHFNCVEHDRVRFHLKKRRKIERLEALLARLGIEYTKVPSYGGRVFITFHYDKIEKRYDESWYAAWPQQLYVISEEVLHWDGSLSHRSFCSKYRQDVDFIQYVWAATGKYTYIRQDEKVWSVGYAEDPLAGIGTDRGEVWFENVPSEDGRAHCFTVPSGMFVTRLNGKISVTGNCFGHNHFFKNNYMFKQWTQPDWIIDYLGYAKRYITRQEELHGFEEVELLLDAAHTLSAYSVDKYNKVHRTKAQQEADIKARLAWEDSQYDELVSPFRETKVKEDKAENIEPTENMLYFIEKFAPNLEDWQREVIRIVRKMGQYFYPQRHTQVMNEGFATTSHYEITNELWDRGLVDERFMLEFIEKHSGVLGQQKIGVGNLKHLNVYTLGFSMFQDIKRRCKEPTKEDELLFPEQINRPFRDVYFEAVKGYKDESFVLQYLSPKTVRDMRLMSLLDDDKDAMLKVSGIANEESFSHVRAMLSRNYDLGVAQPHVSIFDVDWKGGRTLKMQHEVHRRRPLDELETKKILRQVHYLWQYPVSIESIYEDGARKVLTYP